jgi:hypothetical protein
VDEIVEDERTIAGRVANDIVVRTCIRSLAPAAEAPASGSAPGDARAELRKVLTTAADLVVASPLDAAVLYERARAMCQAEGLAQDEVTVVLALGWICAAVGAHEQAARSYGEAAVLAERECLWALACEAWLETGERRSPADYAGAAMAFRSAAAAATLAGLVVLRIEALRLAGLALLALGREHEASVMWTEAVSFGCHTDVQRYDGLGHVAEKLVELLRRHGRMRSAASVEMAVAALRDGDR